MEKFYSALIPLRGGSKSIPLKNIKIIGGQPLCYWVLKACVDSNIFKEIVVSTDSAEIKSVVQSLGLPIRIIDRPSEYATDDASTESVMLHASRHMACDVMVTVQATSPLLAAKDLVDSKRIYENHGLHSVLTAVRTKRFFWTDECTPINYSPQHRPRRQDFKGTLMENGSFYFTDVKMLLKEECRLVGKIGIFEMDEATTVEIDELNDWAIVETLLKSRLK